jgi:diguanylate cyclase (GGDEF)-like protein/PAS domain S-box-containing protein
MPASEPGRRVAAPAQVLLGALVAGTALYIVPTLVLNGAVVAAVVAAVLWLGGAGAIWLFHLRDLRRAEGRAAEERDAHRLYRTLIEHGAEAHIVVSADGGVRYASPNVTAVLGIDRERLEDRGGLIDLVRPSDRHRALKAYARLRRVPGAATSLEVGARHPDGAECFLDVHATNLADSPEVGGILVTIRDITPRKTFETEIQHLAYYDPLTGLANRRFLFEQGTTTLSMARRRGTAAAIFYIDLDGFKDINDQLGHEQGDRLLEQVAEALRTGVREADIVARVGGDEFAVVLSEVADANAAGRVADRLRRRIPHRIDADGPVLDVAASVGVAVFPEDGEGLEPLLKAADLAMHQAKAEGTGLQFYRAGLRAALEDQLRMEEDLRVALEQHEFQLHYQPVFHLASGEMAGAEALSRWRHVSRGLVAATEFIRLAERSGLIRSLDRWAIARAIQQWAAQRADDRWPGWVSVNLSPLSVSDPELPSYIRRALEAADLPPGALVLELPAASVSPDAASAADLMWKLKNTGAAIALDDFGTGRTSLSQLKELPIDILKLHPDFIAGIGESADEELLEATISIAHGVRARVLAKGVETEKQAAWLRSTGCDFIQGFLLGGPVPPESLADGRDPAKREEPDR